MTRMVLLIFIVVIYRHSQSRRLAFHKTIIENVRQKDNSNNATYQSPNTSLSPPDERKKNKILTELAKDLKMKGRRRKEKDDRDEKIGNSSLLEKRSPGQGKDSFRLENGYDYSDRDDKDYKDYMDRGGDISSTEHASHSSV